MKANLISKGEARSPTHVTFVLATLNEAHRIDRCLRSIRDQDYDQRAVDILVADGGSSDDTLARCEKYGARVLPNPLVRCEPGIAMLIERVSDGLIVVFAADNALLGRDWLARVTSAFDAPDVVASFCRVASDGSQGSLSSRYLNRFTDPYNHFVYWGGADYPSLPSTYGSQLERREGDTYFFRFGIDDCPLIALAQGVAFRAPHARDPQTDEDDIVPFAEVARTGLTAYVSDVRLSHAQVRDLWELLRKYGPRIREKLFPDSPHMLRVKRLNRVRRLRRLVWPLYAFALPLTVSIGVVMALKEREALWLYHPVISFAMACCLVRELLRVAPSLVRAWWSRSLVKVSP
jgi:glycosyltransferase involved in cell wall biosynthesis